MESKTCRGDCLVRWHSQRTQQLERGARECPQGSRATSSDFRRSDLLELQLYNVVRWPSSLTWKSNSLGRREQVTWQWEEELDRLFAPWFSTLNFHVQSYSYIWIRFKKQHWLSGWPAVSVRQHVQWAGDHLCLQVLSKEKVRSHMKQALITIMQMVCPKPASDGWAPVEGGVGPRPVSFRSSDWRCACAAGD